MKSSEQKPWSSWSLPFWPGAVPFALGPSNPKIARRPARRLGEAQVASAFGQLMRLGLLNKLQDHEAHQIPHGARSSELGAFSRPSKSRYGAAKRRILSCSRWLNSRTSQHLRPHVTLFLPSITFTRMAAPEEKDKYLWSKKPRT